NRLVVEVDEEGVDIQPDFAAGRVGLQAGDHAALRLGLEQAPALGLNLRIRTELDLCRLKRVAHAAVQRDDTDRMIRCLPESPHSAETAGQSIDVLRRRDLGSDSATVDANFVARLPRGVPAKAGQPAGSRRELIVALRVQADEAPPVVELDGTFWSDRFGARNDADAVEPEPLTVAQA